MLNLLTLSLAGATLVSVYVALAGWRIRQNALRRLRAADHRETGVGIVPAPLQGWLARWLSLAGYRHPAAPLLFLASTAVCLGVGWILGRVYESIWLAPLVETVIGIPSVGEVLAATLASGPWTLLAIAASVPTIVVRAARRRRVREIESNLPLVLELFATMAEAGLGFDAALLKIVASQGGDQPLVSELVIFQREMLAGVPRFQGLRQLARRVEVTSLTTFTSAVIQAEQVGASIAETLRHQADDLRVRRREHALLLAQALPVKLVFPLVLCFMPGIFVSTLAPVIYQMIQVADSVLRTGGR
jgi:tight adherence protein C